ncbi:hypothetical protein [Pseudomonas aeruginosa]|uniref:hypothetical protein n=4 Tax=Pseudomonas aeruginosa TaxID=287 RepID=UPI001A27425F|nr:hypothetical protein [Pseudomonas aeruginosa]MBG6976027.1 hypothetical protein [Pseudomonas aeruginosa]MBG7548047.1 hypothetical protein [Pseudomonas aeruginosa]MCU9028214.1 hypothetical protein [Pseudomonas aeruginosa]MCY0283460.1 hypothetical protein [Pseudomonas aeruginosa]MCY0413072.1 hypothetical protein [Pseudomonas aeruginosa]
MSSTQHQLIEQCATRLRGIVEALDNIHDNTPHRWSTDLDDVHSSAESLLALIKDQAPARSEASFEEWLANELEGEDGQPVPTAACDITLARRAFNHWPKLEQPAKVGGVRFSAGVSSRLVVEAAQRLYEFESTPEKEAERIDPEQESVEQAGGDERAAFERAFTVQEGIYFDDKRGEYRSMNLRAIEATDAQDLNLRLQGWQARAALAQPSPVRSSLLINGYQLRAALDFIAPDGTAEQLESEACIEWRQQDADFLEADLYAFCAEYPEEGGVLLDEEPTTAQPSPLQSEQAEAERPALWAVHAQEPDELYAAFTREDAEKHAAELNALPMPEGIAVGAVVVPSPWPEAEHWKYLAEQERDHKNEIAGRLRQFERICEGLPQDAIDGGWTVQGIRGYAKRLEDQLKAAQAEVEALRAELQSQRERNTELIFKLGSATNGWGRCEKERDAALAKVAGLEAELETERMRLAACGTAALGYFDGCADAYKSASLSDVLRLRGDCDSALARVAELERQEPVALANRGLHAFWVKWTEAAARLYGPGIKLYAAPVAQAQQLHDLDKQCRDDVARALGLRPNQERGFAWSYLLASIKSCVKASGDSAQAQHSVPIAPELMRALGLVVAALEADGDRPTSKYALSELKKVLAAAPGKEVPQAWIDVQAERRRQVEAEGWTPEHDDLYCAAELPRAAAAYILNGANDEAPAIWPFVAKWWKPRDARSNYVRASALILAEIERLDRAGISQSPQPGATTASS